MFSKLANLKCCADFNQFLKYMVISESNLKTFCVKQKKHFAGLQYKIFLYNNKWNKNVKKIYEM